MKDVEGEQSVLLLKGRERGRKRRIDETVCNFDERLPFVLRRRSDLQGHPLVVELSHPIER